VASAVILVGVQFNSPLPDGFDAVVTLVWIVGITNALNLLDNIDGLAAGVTAVAGTAIFVIALMYDQPLTAVLAVGLAGSSIGFLRSNFNPATIYMGDSGSLYLGFLLSYLALKLRVDPKETTQLFVPVVVLGVAVMDTALVVLSRLRRGVHPFEGGKDHISHRVVRLGISVRRGVTVILLSAMVLGALGVALSQMPERYGWWVLGAAGVHAAALVVLLTTKSALAVSDQVPGTVSLFRRKSAG
jgi:UDP-GlcNAc:undecaprenyl-phosphate GlcNAc-1-phosphate transferase